MPQNRNNPEPPEVMTWMKASPVIAVALIFYLLRSICEMFWFFGPALAGVYCTVKATGIVTQLTNGILGGKTAAAFCTGIAGALGYFGAPVFEAMGSVMAIAVGLLGWLTVIFLLLIFNGRIFKENTNNLLWYGLSLLGAEIPIVGVIPTILGITIKMYHSQIKKDKAALKKWQEEQKNNRSQKRMAQEQLAAELTQARNAQLSPAEI